MADPPPRSAEQTRCLEQQTIRWVAVRPIKTRESVASSGFLRGVCIESLFTDLCFSVVQWGHFFVIAVFFISFLLLLVFHLYYFIFFYHYRYYHYYRLDNFPLTSSLPFISSNAEDIVSPSNLYYFTVIWNVFFNS